MKTIKTKIAMFGTAMMLCLLTFSARAGILFQENFDAYAQGPLPTNNLAVSPWSGNSGTPATSPTTGIVVVPDPTAASANALQVNAALTQDIIANFATNAVYADVAFTNVVGPFITNIVVGVSTNIYGTSTNYFYGFSPSNSVNALYESMTIYVTTLPNVASGSQTYFTHFDTSSGSFKCRLFIVTNGIPALGGKFRIAIQNAGSAVTNTIPTDLNIGTAYTIVSRYVLSSGICTVWVSPNSETNANSATPLDAPSTAPAMSAYSYRQNTGEGVIDVDNLVIGTTFADVVPGSVNPPVIVTQPQDSTTPFIGGTVSFTNLALGDPTIAYQWYYNTNILLTNNSFSVSGTTGRILTLTNLVVLQSGTYSCVSANPAGTNVTRFATLLVNSVPVPPAITNQPTGLTLVVGDNATFTTVAGGSAPLAYQWKVDNGTVTNVVVGALFTGTNTPTLTITGVTTSLSGLKYFVTITNAFGSTNSAKALLTVNPPPVLTIAAFRAMVDNTYAPTNTTALYTIQGTVTTWTNMTTSSTSLEFYMQDNTGGIAVFWSGANPTNLPPAGSIVRATGPMAAFNGLLEIEPVFTNTLTSVTVLGSTSLPAAQPLPFDPNITGNMATMKALESMYFVASNVTLTAGATYVSGANEPITVNANQTNTFANSTLTFTFTNLSGQTFTLFVGGSTDIPGKAKDAGPVTIYGILGYFTANGFELTPSRFADIISYVHFTNILANARKGDLATNSYTENVVRSGETITTYVSITDAAGGSVTLTPTGTLPTGASWNNVVNGLTATAVFQYTGSAADAGNNFPIQLAVSSTAGTSFIQTFNIYVPTAQEQQIAISEFLANPTTNPAAAFFNPLKRSTDTIGISTNDQYIEIANQSGSDMGPGNFTIDTGNPAKPVFNANAGAGATVPSLGSLVAYGGNAGETPGVANATLSSGLFLPTTGNGLLVLRNGNGNIIDRVVYAASDLSTNGSLSRFPTINSAFVPQAYISTNLTTAGLQYDGGSWGSATKIPTGVTGVTITYVNGQAVFNFTANTSQASTLWDASDVSGPYSVIFGKTFPSGTGTFTNVNSATKQFYFITTQ
jgi:hypothetical protein